MTSRSNLATDCQEMVFVVESDYDIEIRGLHATDEAAAEAARFVVGVCPASKESPLAACNGCAWTPLSGWLQVFGDV